MSEHARTTRPSQRGYRGTLLRRHDNGIQPSSAAPHGAPAPDGVVVRSAAAGARRHAHHRLVRVRPVCRPAPDAGGHRSLRRQGAVPALRLQQHRAPPTPHSANRIALDDSGAFWIDYVADVGDGFEPTYATAYLLAQDSLDVRGAGKLRHGEILIMGGDQCYPQATREEYKKRLLQPFNWAFSVPRARPQAVRHPRQSRLVRRAQRLRQPVLLVARQAFQHQGQHHRRLAVPAAPQLLGAAPAPQLVDLGRRHPVLEISRYRAGQLFRGHGQADAAAATTSSSALPSPRG